LSGDIKIISTGIRVFLSSITNSHEMTIYKVFITVYIDERVEIKPLCAYIFPLKTFMCVWLNWRVVVLSVWWFF
jgi:hypothetical protein